MHTHPLILIIDDEQAILKTLKGALEDESFRIQTLSDGKKAIATIGKLIPDLVLLDIFMPDCNGLELLTHITQEFPQQKIIMISGFGTIAMAIEAVKKGALDFIEKPLNLDEVLAKLAFLKNEPVAPASVATTISYDSFGLVGKSVHFLELMRQAERVAPLHIPLIIYGAHGVGKSTLAHFIHQKNKIGEFIVVDCATTNNKLNELLNHSGTVYLKNISLMPPREQTELAQLLQSQPTARVIASSVEPLFNLLNAGQFNATLFAQLHALPLEIPALKKRQGDIPLLIEHYLAVANNAHGKKIALNTRALRLLINRSWQTNISELKNCLIQLVVTAPTDHHVVTPTDLATILGEKEVQFVEEQQFTNFNSLGEATHAFEKNFLLYLLKKNHYNVEQVAFQLSLSAPELRNKITELKIAQ